MSEISSRTFEQLQLLANNLENNPDYLAGVFTSYQKIEGLSDAQLRILLGASPLTFLRLSICKRPIADSLDFAQELRQICDYANTDATVLANIIRQVDSLEVFQSKPEEEPRTHTASQLTDLPSGLLAAARDQVNEEQESYEGDSESTDQDENRRGRDDLADE